MYRRGSADSVQRVLGVYPEIVGIGWDSRAIPTPELLEQLQPVVDLTHVKPYFGPFTEWHPGGPEFAKYMSLYVALYGGLINKPADAVAYAHALMGTKPELASVPETAQKAEERGTVWHITASGQAREILTFSRIDGKLLSSDL